jgi:hypothetical protein
VRKRRRRRCAEAIFYFAEKIGNRDEAAAGMGLKPLKNIDLRAPGRHSQSPTIEELEK